VVFYFVLISYVMMVNFVLYMLARLLFCYIMHNHIAVFGRGRGRSKIKNPFHDFWIRP